MFISLFKDHIQYTEAYDLLKKTNDSSRNAKILEAQLLYRMERYEESLKVYKEISNNVQSIFIFLIFQEEYDYITNLSACYLLSDNAAEGASSLEKYKVIIFENIHFSQVKVMKSYIIMVHY